MHLIDDWKRVLRDAWSSRFLLLVILLAGVDASAPFLQNYIPQEWFPAFIGVSAILALGSRLIYQEKLHK